MSSDASLGATFASLSFLFCLIATIQLVIYDYGDAILHESGVVLLMIYL